MLICTFERNGEPARPFRDRKFFRQAAQRRKQATIGTACACGTGMTGKYSLHRQSQRGRCEDHANARAGRHVLLRFGSALQAGRKACCGRRLGPSRKLDASAASRPLLRRRMTTRSKRFWDAKLTLADFLEARFDNKKEDINKYLRHGVGPIGADLHLASKRGARLECGTQRDQEARAGQAPAEHGKGASRFSETIQIRACRLPAWSNCSCRSCA